MNFKAFFVKCSVGKKLKGFLSFPLLIYMWENWNDTSPMNRFIKIPVSFYKYFFPSTSYHSSYGRGRFKLKDAIFNGLSPRHLQWRNNILFLRDRVHPILSLCEFLSSSSTSASTTSTLTIVNNCNFRYGGLQF